MRQRLRHGFTALALVAVTATGCAPHTFSHWGPSPIVAHVDGSDFEPDRVAYGASEWLPESLDGFYSLKSFISRNDGTVHHNLLVIDFYKGSGWRFWESVHGEGGTVFTVNVSRELGHCNATIGCEHTETVAALIPESVLRDKVQSGLNVKVYSQSGLAPVLYITPAQIAMQLRMTDSVVRALGLTTRARVSDNPPVNTATATAVASTSGSTPWFEWKDVDSLTVGMPFNEVQRRIGVPTGTMSIPGQTIRSWLNTMCTRGQGCRSHLVGIVFDNADRLVNIISRTDSHSP